MSLKILKVTKIENDNCKGLEVEIELDLKLKTEFFDGYDEWMQEENGEHKFITHLKENHLKSESEKLQIFNMDQEQKEKKTELTKYKNQVIA